MIWLLALAGLWAPEPAGPTLDPLGVLIEKAPVSAMLTRTAEGQVKVIALTARDDKTPRPRLDAALAALLPEQGHALALWRSAPSAGPHDVQILPVPDRLIRPAFAFIGDWSAGAQRKTDGRLDELIGLLSHPWPPARRVAWRSILVHASAFRGQMTSDRIRRLVEILLEPGRSEAAGGLIVRALLKLGGQAAADKLAPRLADVRGRRLKFQVARGVAGFPSPTTRRALDRCAHGTPGALAAQCRRLLLDLDTRGRQ